MNLLTALEADGYSVSGAHDAGGWNQDSLDSLTD